VAEPRDLSVQAIAGRAGLVAKDKLPVPLGKLGRKTFNGTGRAVDVANKAYLAIASCLGDGDRDLQLRRIQSDINIALLLHGSSPHA
jgi:hypothetical protein